MNIDNLTFGQLKQIAAMSAPAPVTAHPFVGQYVLVRCHSAGVHAGVLVSQDGDRAVLRDSRRLWSWSSVSGVALSGVAQAGINRTKSKVDTINPAIALTGVIETIPCTAAAQESIHGA